MRETADRCIAASNGRVSETMDSVDSKYLSPAAGAAAAVGQKRSLIGCPSEAGGAAVRRNSRPDSSSPVGGSHARPVHVSSAAVVRDEWSVDLWSKRSEEE